MDLSEAIIVWTPHTDLVRLERKGSAWNRTNGDRWMPAYALGELGTYPRSKLSDLLGMFVLFNTITVRDKCPVESTHNAFLGIEAYRRAISPDSPGADS